MRPCLRLHWLFGDVLCRCHLQHLHFAPRFSLDCHSLVQFGHTALSLAAKNKSRDIVIALLRAGASLKRKTAVSERHCWRLPCRACSRVVCTPGMQPRESTFMPSAISLSDLAT